MGIYVGLSLLVLLLLFLWFWVRATTGRADAEVSRRGDLGGLGRSGLTRRSFVGLGAALGVTVGVLSRVGSLKSLGLARATTPAPILDPCAPIHVSVGEPMDILKRLIMPLSSGSNIPPNTSVLITGRPQNCTFRPERVVVSNSDDWWIEDMSIGDVPHLSPGGVPGGIFGALSLDSGVRFACAGPATDVSIRARYVGGSAQGAPFVCGVLGTAVS